MLSNEELKRAEEAADARRREGDDIDSVLAFLRGSGLSIIECIKVVMPVENVRLGQAKRIVHSSSAWSDVRAANEEFHERLIQAVEAEVVDRPGTDGRSV